MPTLFFFARVLIFYVRRLFVTNISLTNRRDMSKKVGGFERHLHMGSGKRSHRLWESEELTRIELNKFKLLKNKGNYEI